MEPVTHGCEPLFNVDLRQLSGKTPAGVSRSPVRCRFLLLDAGHRGVSVAL